MSPGAPLRPEVLDPAPSVQPPAVIDPPPFCGPGDRWVRPPAGSVTLNGREVLSIRYREWAGGYRNLLFQLGGPLALDGPAAPLALTAETAALKAALALPGSERG